MAVMNAIIIVVFFICFGPFNSYLSFVLSLVSYFTTIITFVSLFCVQVVQYFYFTSNWIVVLDYYDENTAGASSGFQPNQGKNTKFLPFVEIIFSKIAFKI